MVLSLQRGAFFHKIYVSKKLSKNDWNMFSKSIPNRSKIDYKSYHKKKIIFGLIFSLIFDPRMPPRVFPWSIFDPRIPPVFNLRLICLSFAHLGWQTRFQYEVHSQGRAHFCWKNGFQFVVDLLGATLVLQWPSKALPTATLVFPRLSQTLPGGTLASFLELICFIKMWNM